MQHDLFWSDAQKRFFFLGQIFLNPEPDYQKVLREMHTVKGSFHVLGEVEIVKLIHFFETLLQDVEKKNLQASTVLNSFFYEFVETIEDIIFLGEKKLGKDIDVIAIIRRNLETYKVIIKTQSVKESVHAQESSESRTVNDTTEKVLAVKFGNQTCYIPSSSIDRVIYKPELVTIQNSSLIWLETELTSFVSIDSLYNVFGRKIDIRSQRLSYPWVVVLKKTMEKQAPSFCVSVDDVIGLEDQKDAVLDTMLSVKFSSHALRRIA